MMPLCYRRARHYCLRLIALGHVFISCAFTDAVFDVPQEEFRKNVYNGEYQFLHSISYGAHDLNDVAHVHNGARYYLSLIYRSLDRDDVAASLLKMEWAEGGDGVWRYEAGLQLLEEFSERRDYYQAAKMAKEGLDVFGQNNEYLYYYLEALYWQREYDQVIALLDDFRSEIRFEQRYAVKTLRDKSAEAQLWEAVSRYRGNIEYDQAEFDELFFNYLASPYHTRVYDYIIDEPRLRASFAEWQLAFYRGKHFSNVRAYDDAAAAYEEAFQKMPAAMLGKVLTLRSIRDVGRAYLYGGYSRTGLARLAEVTPRFYGAQRAALLEWRGRLHTRSQNYTAAYNALSGSQSVRPSDTALWLIFNAAFGQSFDRGIKAMRQHGAEMRNRAYYSDLFDNQMVALLRARQWNRLWQLRDVMIKYGSARDRAHIAVVIAEGVRTGLTRRPRHVSLASMRKELEFARNQRESAHYAYLAAFMLRKNATMNFASRYRYRTTSDLSRAECRELVSGYWHFHLMREGYGQLRECVNYYRTDELIAIAKDLHRRGVFNYAMRVVDIACTRRDFRMNASLARILYPHAYAQFIHPIARGNDLPRYFFYATIREESYFTTAANSHAGAVGLGQFIPSTARAVAARMNVPYPDLTDPEQNLRLSGFHLNELIEQLDDKPLFALSAYNAGIGRARRWINIYDDYSDLLKHESIHFHETRHYVRKIMVSHIQYARIYQNTPARRVITQYFTDLAPL